MAGRWWTATQAWACRDSLSKDELGDLRAYLGWPYSSEEVEAADAVSDRWLVLGAHRSGDGRLQQQRTWLWGETTHQTVQLLDFAAGGQPLPVAQTVGALLDATLARYPGTTSRRARLVGAPVPVQEPRGLPAGGGVPDALAVAAEAWAVNAWAARVPVVLTDVRLSVSHLVDGDHRSLPLLPGTDLWLALAVSGGDPVTVFAEVEERGARPLSVEAHGRLVAL
jgi:hypothetical protein